MGSGLTFRVFRVGNLIEEGGNWVTWAGGGDRLDWCDPLDMVGLGCRPWRDWFGFEYICMTGGTRGRDCVFKLLCLSRKAGDGDISRGGTLCMEPASDMQVSNEFGARTGGEVENELVCQGLD